MNRINLIGVNGYIGSGKDTVGSIIVKLTAEVIGNGMFATWSVRKFADKLKDIAEILTSIPKYKFEDQEFKKSLLSVEWDSQKKTVEKSIASVERKAMTVREFLQRLGTDAMRDNLHKNVWVNALFANYTPYPKEKAHSGSILDENCYMHPKCNSCGNAFYGYKRQTRCKECIETALDIYPNWVITDCRFPNEAQAIKERGGIVVRVNRSESNSTSSKHPSETSLDNWNFDYEIANDDTLPDLEEKVKEMLLYFNILR